MLTSALVKFTAVCALLLFAITLAAQVPQPESLVIGAGDLLHVQFYDTPELEQRPRVNDAGAVPLIFLGAVPLAGKTPAQASTLIASLMVAQHFMTHPQVVVSIEQYATQGVTISGEVSHPGNYAIATPRSVLDVLSLAGGLNALADRHIVIEHRTPNVERTLYFVSNDPARQLDTDMLIRPGDVILVPRVGLVYILGDVGRPGGYPLTSNDGRITLLQALANAGSPNKTAVTSGVKLMRKSDNIYTEVPLHLARIEKGKEPDPLLLANDVVFVPFSYLKNFVLTGASVAASVGSAVIVTH